jgi:hypothetical protein
MTKKLKEALEEIPFPMMVDFVEDMWMQEGERFRWNSDNSLEDLKNDDANTYGAYSMEGIVDYEGYRIINGDMQQGFWITLFFNLDKEIEWMEED